MRIRGIVASLLIVTAGLFAIGATDHHPTPPRISNHDSLGPLVGTMPGVDLEAVAAEEHEQAVTAFVAWLAAEDAKAVTAYLDAIAPKPPPPPARAQVASQPAPNRGSCNGDVECFLACTIEHESISSGTYGAVSPGGTYRGAYQFDQQTWDGAVARAGYPQYVGVPPDQAPAAVQDAAATQLYSERGNQPWGGRC